MADDGAQDRLSDRVSGATGLRAFGRGFWRRRMGVLAPTLIAALAAVAFVEASPPSYRSTAVVLIGERADAQAAASQALLIRSRDLVRQVTKSLDLAADPEFLGDRPGLVGALMAALGGGADGATSGGEKAVDNVARGLAVSPAPGAQAVRISFVAKNPATAAKVANAFAEAYLDMRRSAGRANGGEAGEPPAGARILERGAVAALPYFPEKAPTIALATLAAFLLSLFACAARVLAVPRRPETGDAEAPPAVGDASPAFGRLRGPAPRQDVADAAPPAARLPDDAQPSSSAVAGAAGEAVKRPPARPTPAMAAAETIECADATLVAALARQLAAAPREDCALKILAVGAAPGLDAFGVASRLATTISDQGRRVVLLDVSGAVRSDGRPGLSDLLLGEATFARAIHRDHGSRVHLVPQGSESLARLDARAVARLSVVIDALALTYDFVMVAAPAGPGGGDVFAPFCGAALLLSDTSASDARTVEAHERLKRTGIEDVVVLLVPGEDGRPRGCSLAA